MDTLATQCILLFFLLFLFLWFFFCNLKSIFRKQTILHVRYVQSKCADVIYHFEDPTCASRTLKTGSAVSAGEVNVGGERCTLCFSRHQLCWPQHLLYQHVLLFKHKMCTLENNTRCNFF